METRKLRRGPLGNAAVRTIEADRLRYGQVIETRGIKLE
jgi:hypothetical protein